MISIKYIKQLEFKILEDIFNYIIDSEINGNYSQVKELVKKLSNNQFKIFCDWFNNSEFNTMSDKGLNWYVSKRIEQ